MKFKVIVIVIIVSFIASCNVRTDDFWFLERDQDFLRIKSAFQNYIGFFPKPGDAKTINRTWSLNPDKEFNIKIVFKFKPELFRQSLDTIRKNSIAKYASDMDGLLVLNRFSTHSNYGYPNGNEIDPKIIDLDCYKDLYPIPNFSNFSAYQTDKTECRLQEGFSIYVLESEVGRFLSEEKLTNGKYMPEYWKHGYSKGVAVNESEKIMIYWVIIW